MSTAARGWRRLFEGRGSSQIAEVKAKQEHLPRGTQGNTGQEQAQRTEKPVGIFDSV